MKSLPINESPYIRSYTEYAYPHMILNNTFATGEKTFEGVISEKFDDKWIIKSGISGIDVSDNRITVTEPCFALPKAKYIYRTLKKNDQLVLKIEYQQYTNKWDTAGIFINNASVLSEKLDKDKFVFGNYCGSFFMIFNEGEEKLIKLPEDEKKYPIWLKVQVSNSDLEAAYSTDGNDWEVIQKSKELILGEGNVIGVYTSVNNRLYYKWVFNNYINLCLDVNYSSLNYCAMMKRDSKNYTVNPILQISREKKSVLDAYGVDLWSFIISNIDQNRYIEFWLNEKYVDGQEAYNYIDFTHENLVYGYDDETKTVMMISIYEGKPVKRNIKICNFCEAYEKADRRRAARIYIFDFYPSNGRYAFDPKSVILQLKQYLSGENPTIEYRRFITEEEGVFGIKCYDALLTDKNTQKIFLNDFRMSYVLQEHKKCMKDRIEYMTMHNCLILDECTEINNLMQNICYNALMIMNLILINKRRQSERVEVKIWNLISEIKHDEIECYSQLIEKMEQVIKEKKLY